MMPNSHWRRQCSETGKNNRFTDPRKSHSTLVLDGCCQSHADHSRKHSNLVLLEDKNSVVPPTVEAVDNRIATVGNRPRSIPVAVVARISVVAAITEKAVIAVVTGVAKEER